MARMIGENAYFQHVFHRFPVLDRADLSTDEPSMAILQGVCMLGTMVWHKAADPLANNEKFYYRAKMLILTEHEKDPMTALQTMYLLTTRTIISPAVLTADNKLLSAGLGRSTYIREAEFDVRRPTEEDFEIPGSQILDLRRRPAEEIAVESAKILAGHLCTSHRLLCNHHRLRPLVDDQDVRSAFNVVSLVAASCIARLYEEMDLRDDIHYLLGIHMFFRGLTAMPQLLFNGTEPDPEHLCSEELDILVSTTDAERPRSARLKDVGAIEHKQQGVDELSEAEVRRIIRKVDSRLIVIYGFKIAISLLDGANLSHANIAAMSKDLELQGGTRYSFVALIFFAPYVIAEVPCAALVRRIAPRWTLPPHYYRMGVSYFDEIHKRYSLFYFIGLNAHKARKFLTKREVEIVLRRIEKDRGDTETDLRFSTTTGYTVAYFLPIILNQKLGYGVAVSQILTTPPYLFAGLFMYVEGWFCDRWRVRSPVLLYNAVQIIVGLCLLAWTKLAGSQYFGIFLVTSGCNANIPATLAWQANNIRGHWTRTFCSAVLVAMGGLGGIIGALIFCIPFLI
ncbi:hypothetical protein ABEF95_002783 [Exophiala dermatitidis]